MVCPGRGRASAPRLRVVPRVQVAHCPVDLLYADTRRPSSGWRGPSATESVHASLRPPLRPTGDSVPIYRVPYSRPASIALGAWGAGRGAGSECPTYGSLHAKSTLCMCRPRQPTSGHPSYREPMWGDQPGGVTRDHARPQRWLRSPHTVISPAAAVPMSAVSFDPLPPGAVQLCGAAWGGAPFGCRLGRSTIWVPPGAEHRVAPPGAERHSGAAWGGAPRHCSRHCSCHRPAIALVSIVSVVRL